MHPRRAPYESAIQAVADLGFSGVELLAMDRDELDTYYTPRRVASLRKLVHDAGLEVSQFALYSTACQGLAGPDPAARDHDLAVAARALDVCAGLGCRVFNFVSHWPTGLRTPHPYPPAYIHPSAHGVPRVASTKLTMELPDDLDFAATWSFYATSMQAVCALAAERDVVFAIEGHANVLVPGVDAMLRLFEHVGATNLVGNLDTAWHLMQREYLPLTIHKLRDRLAHVQVRDGDGLLWYTLPPGEGIIDWHGVFRALVAIGYDGFVSLELVELSHAARQVASAKQYLDRVLKEVLV